MNTMQALRARFRVGALPVLAWAGGLVLSVGLGGCPSRGPASFPVEPAPTVSPAAQQAAAKIYAERCQQCHGPGGAGDGPMAKALVPRPQNLRDKVWQSNATNKRLRKVLVYGGAAVGKSAVMTGAPDLEKSPEVVDGLIVIVRGFSEP